LKKGDRHHVHLSPDEETARKVGQRRGRPSILKVESGRMHREGHEFFLSANGVWLTEHVPPEYLIF
jgi:putative RNA 2'-phosphotransferase